MPERVFKFPRLGIVLLVGSLLLVVAAGLLLDTLTSKEFGGALGVIIVLIIGFYQRSKRNSRQR
jgi:hypothetical protein